MSKNIKLPKNYASAIIRLEEIVGNIEEQSLDIDLLAEHVKEANELIKYCSDKLNTVNNEVEKLLSEDSKR